MPASADDGLADVKAAVSRGDVARDGGEAGAAATTATATEEQVRRLEAELRAAAADLQAAEERFRALQQTSSDGFMVFDSVRDPETGAIADFRWSYCNLAAARTLGHPPSWFPGRRLLEEMPGNRQEGLFDSYVGVVETGRTWNGELLYRHEGVDLYVRVTAAKVGDGFAVSFKDLSARRRAERALEENERRLQAVFDQQFQFLALLAPDGALLQINDLPLRAVGTTREAVLGRKFWDTPWWDDLPEMRAAWPARLADAARADGPVLSEDRYQAADGSVRVADCAITAIRDGGGSADGGAGAVSFFLVQATDVTERRRVETALRESEERYRTLFNSIDDGFCVMEMLFDPDDPTRCVDYRFLEVNPTFEKQTGLRDARGKTARELVPDLEQHWFDTYGRVALTGEPIRFQNGSAPMGDRWFDVYAARVGEPEQRRVALLFSDITERRRAEAALRASEERYRTLFESIDEGFCVIEVLFDGESGRATDYRFVEVNPAFEKQTGLRDAQGKRMRELVPDHDENWFEIYGRVALTGEPIRFQNGAHALGRWFDLYALRVGRPEERRVAVVFNDITERRRWEEALRESEERFRTLADNMAQLAWMADATGQLFWFNQRWYDYTGMTLDQAASGPAVRSTWLHPDDAQRVRARFRGRLAEGAVWEDTFRLRDADGRYRWFLSRAVPIRDQEGRVTQWFGTNTDVTEQREAERRDRFLTDLSARLRSLADPDAVVAEALRATGEFFGADRAGFVDVDQEADRVVVHPDWTPPGSAGASPAGEYPLRAFADAIFEELAAGRTVAVEDIAADPRVGEPNRAAMEGFGIRALLSVPLRAVDGHWIGALAVNAATPRAWTPEEVALLEAVADRLRVARGGALLRRREREVADRNARVAGTLQMSLLSPPAEDAFPGMRVGTVYEAAGDEAALGGDFFDAFALSPDRVALVVGDVAGKGLEAAAYTAEVKFSLRALLREHGDPAQALTGLNKLLIVSDAPRLVALCVAVLDTATGTLRVASGGAEPPLLVRQARAAAVAPVVAVVARDGGGDFGAAAQIAVEGGPMLGVDADVEYAATAARMAAGDLLLLLTDGITEARRGRTFFGPEGAAAAAWRARAAGSGGGGSIAAVADSVVESARAFAGGALRDDACLLVACLDCG